MALIERIAKFCAAGSPAGGRDAGLKYDVFISYRRDGGDTLAQLLYDRLTSRGYSVFLDIESLRSGLFNEALLSIIDECRDVVLILPPEALERCRNPGDWVYLELTHALKRGKNIVPVLMRGFHWPEEMPQGLEQLRNFNGVQDSKDYFDAVMDKLALLLTSKPSAFPKRKKKPKKPGSAKARRRKWLALGAAALAAAVVGVGLWQIPGRLEESRLEKLASTVELYVTPQEDMSANDYYDALDTLEQRFTLLAGEETLELTEEEGALRVSLPLEAFRGLDVSSTLQSYITRPTRLYVGAADGVGDLKAVDRADILDLELRTGDAAQLRLDLIPQQDYLPQQEEYQYLWMELSPELCQKIREVCGDGEVYRLVQDAEEFSSYYYYYLIRGEEENTFCLVDNNQFDNINELVLYNYQNDPFAMSFTFQIQMPAAWEDPEEAAQPGANQCGVLELQEPYITLQYATDGEFTEGEFSDAVKTMKARLDALDTPYALGYTMGTGDGYDLSVRLSPERLGEELIYALPRSVYLSVQGAFDELLSSYAIEGICLTGQGDGSYTLEVTPTEQTNRAQLAETAGRIAGSGDGTVYLCMGDMRLAQAEMSTAFDGETIRFENLSYLGKDSLGEEERFLADFLNQLAQSPELTSGGQYYSLQFSYFDGCDVEDVGVLYTVEEQAETYGAIVEEIWPNAQWAMLKGDLTAGMSLRVYLDLELDQQFPERANQLIQRLYEACDMTSGALPDLDIYLLAPPDRGAVYCFFYTSIYAHGVSFGAGCTEELLGEYAAPFRALVESDPFYQTGFTDSSTGWSFY